LPIKNTSPEDVYPATPLRKGYYYSIAVAEINQASASQPVKAMMAKPPFLNL
jgi:hypothetical protein